MNNSAILLGRNNKQAEQSLLLQMANRHGLIAGATGTGKTVTLRTLAEGFSRAGVPVFTADVKGDLSGIAYPGTANDRIAQRLAEVPVPGHSFRGYPTLFWDLFGKSGHHLRTTVSELGPILLTRLLDLNEVQSGVISAAFKLADDQTLPLLDLKDLRALLNWMAENSSTIQANYGNVTKASVGAVQRELLVLEEAGGTEFFGEPALKIEHLMQRDFSGNGVINVLDATTLINNPRIYSTLLLWLLAELFENLPEVGDLEKPKLVFFFDEAHLLFSSAPKALLERIEQTVRLIRSRGVGIFFVTQNPIDIPETVAGQLGNRLQHALRAFTAKDKKAVTAAAETFRENSTFNTEDVIQNLGVGEALVSLLDSNGIPTPVERTLVAAPESRLGAISEAERMEIVKRSPYAATYSETIDRESAYELLMARKSTANGVSANTGARSDERTTKGSSRASPLEAFFASTARAIGSQVGRELIRGVLGSILRTRR